MVASPILARVKQFGRSFRDRLYRVGDTLGVLNPETFYSEEYYQKRQEDPWRSDARSVSKALDEVFEPRSVIDFGCAIGGHLEWFHERGVEVHGVEGNSKAFNHAVVPVADLEEHDLRQRFESSNTYDLAICIEVAEHIPARFAGTLLDSITDSARTVFFTAAPPGQDGTHHIHLRNEQYWEDEFEKRGFQRMESFEQRLKQEIEVEETTWVTENIFVFRKDRDESG